MALPLPNLDDRTYAELVEQAISQISVDYPEWTDHNPTDTGIILIELLAWLTEMTLYRVNQIPDDNYAQFVSLLQGKQWKLPNVSSEEKHKTLKSEIQKNLLELRYRYRAVTTEDYEKLVLEDWNQSPKSNGLTIARLKCLPQRNLEDNDTDTIAKGHISLVVIPEKDNKDETYKPLFDFLDKRRLLTTKIHIVEPEYVPVYIEAKLVLKDGAQAEDVKKRQKQKLQCFLNLCTLENIGRAKDGTLVGVFIYQNYIKY